MDKTLTEPKVWSIRRLTEAVGRKDIRLPEFQRSIVWDDDQKSSLIQSLLSGFPIGALLLHHRVGSNEYLLVDGLQRTTTIRDYLDEPLTLLPFSQIPEDACRDLAVALSAHTPEPVHLTEFTAIVLAWMRSVKNIDRSGDFDTIAFVQHVASNFSLPEHDVISDPMLVDAAKILLKALEDAADIADIELPVMIYHGDDSQLPEIFELLNSQGTELGKYDIFAATWVRQETQVVDQLIKDAVREKYRYLIEEKGYEVIGVGPNLQIDSYSLFEYLFGLGKVLSNRYEILFEPTTKAADPDSIAFTLATIGHQSRLGDMRKLPVQIRTIQGLHEDAIIDPRLFQQALDDACLFVQDTLRGFTGMKLNQRSGKPLVVHTEYQIASMIASALAHKYVPGSWVPREGGDEAWAKLRKTLPQHYLFDTIMGVWRGAGDTRLFNRVWQRPSDQDPYVPSPYYLSGINREDWDRALSTWLSQQLQKTQLERGPVDKAQKVFLAFVYSNRINHLQLHRNTFEIEHVIPVSRISQAIKETDPDLHGWPISAMGNLALFTKPLNREKSNSTIAEFIDGIQDETTRERTCHEIQALLFCDIESAELDLGGSPMENLAAYKRWVTENFEYMKKELLDEVLELQ